MASKRLITHPKTGETLSINEWAKKIGISRTTMFYRMRQTNDLEKVLTPETFKQPLARWLTHPKTGETLSVNGWAKKLGLSASTIAHRLTLTNDLEKVLSSQAFKRSCDWTEEEEEYLIAIYKTPNLLRLWNKKAKASGWKPRSLASLNHKIFDLKQQGLIDGRKSLDESDGWLTARQLAKCLGCSRETIVAGWISSGLNAYKETDGITSPYKIHLTDFVRWATSPAGAGKVASTVQGDRLALCWLLIQIGNWAGEKSPRVGMKPVS